MYKPTLKDIPRLKKIWKDVFKDSDSYIDLFFREKFDPEKTFIFRTDGIITSALYYFDVYLSNNSTEIKAGYICGISTISEARGLGQASFLIKECIKELKENNYDIAFLFPASLSLFEFYKKFGFETLSYINTETFALKDTKEIYERNNSLSVYELYNKIPLMKVKRSDNDFAVLNECYGAPYIFGNNYFYAYKSGETVNVIEHNFNDYDELYDKLRLCFDSDIRYAKITSPINIPIGEKIPFSVYINFKNIVFDSKIYINLLLN